jgi:hypothetical protein
MCHQIDAIADLRIGQQFTILNDFWWRRHHTQITAQSGSGERRQQMKDELIQKIQNVLNKRINTEAQVVYLLVEVRKLMDRDQYKDSVLRTFSNWIVHTSLDNPSEGSAFILGEFDHLFAELHERQKKTDQLTHISLGAFREALAQFFAHYGLTTRLLANLSEWKRFSSLYCSIVSECPIVFTASKAKLKYIRQVELTRISPGIVVKEWPIVQWRLTFQDGTVQNWGFHVG